MSEFLEKEAKTIRATAVEMDECPSFSLEEFSSTIIPYEFLWKNYGSNPFLLSMYREQMNEMAKKHGFTKFLKLWQSYMETLQAQEKIDLSHCTDFTGQPVSLFCGDYVCDDGGVSYINAQKTLTIVCRHPILPSKRLVNVDSGEVRLEISFQRGGRWFRHVVERSMLSSSQKIVALSSIGIAVDSENAKELVKYLTAIEADNFERLETVNSVSRLGWINGNEFSPFSEELHFDGDLTFSSMFKAVRHSGFFVDWKRTAIQARKGSVITRIILAASFASALVYPLGLLPFFVHVWGGTEAGKTVGLMLAASVWANPNGGEYIKTFNATAVSLELVAGFCNSLPLCIDELQIIKDRADFDKQIYMLSEGVGRARGAKEGGLRAVPTWQNCIITTGEMPISNGNSGGGAINRVVEIDCKDEKLFTDPRGVANSVRENFGFAGEMFVQKLMEDGAFGKAHAVYDEFYAELIKGESTEKQAMAAACILTADKLINEWIFMDGMTIKLEEIQECLTSKSDVDSNLRAMEWIRDFVAINAQRFDKESQGEMWGEISGEYVYIIKTVFDREIRREGYNPGAFLSWAKRKGLLLTDSDTERCTKKRRICGTLSNCVCINLGSDDGEENGVSNELPF